MRTFKIDLETVASSSGKLKVPPELMTAHLIKITGLAFHEIRATPQHIIDEILFYDHLQNAVQKAQDRKANSAK
jgi:hypothetical protein